MSLTGGVGRRGSVAAGLVALAILSGSGLRAADKTTSLQGRWRLDRDHSQLPDDIGFDIDVDTVSQGAPTANPSTTRSRTTGRSDPSRGLLLAREDEQTLKILSDVTEEARHPWPVVVIDQSPETIVIGDGASEARAFHPGKVDEQRLADGGITTRAKWEKGVFIVDYQIEKDRDVRYTYSRPSDAVSLEVDVSFRDHGKGDVLKRLYQR